MGFCEYGEMDGKKLVDVAFLVFIAEAFGIPFELQGKPLTTVQLVCFFAPYISKP